MKNKNPLRQLLATFSLSALALASTSTSAQYDSPAYAPLGVGDSLAVVRHSITHAVAGVPSQLARATDLGALSANETVEGVTLYLQRTPEQQVAINQLLLDQQNAASPRYHQWLNPTDMAAQFGASETTISKVSQTLSSAGISVVDISNTRTFIRVSASAKAFNAFFQTDLRRYYVDGETHRSNATVPTLPDNLVGTVAAVRGLDDFRPKPNTVLYKPDYTVTSTVHELVPADLATIYDVNPLINGGFTGAGISIAVMGDSTFTASDISTFRTAAGLSPINLTQTLVPNTGTAASNVDAPEATLDVELAGALASSAKIIYVYAGATGNAIDSLQYAIDNNTSPIISFSFGGCESLNGSSNANAIQSLVQTGAAQGQTLIAASGDEGAAACDTGTANTAATTGTSLAVNLPASVPEVTGVGGTSITSNSSSYWSSTNGATGGSALSYIPEVAWNDSATVKSLDATGGGASIYFTKPSWQNISGVPADGKRDVPDLAFSASNVTAPYAYCYQGSCANGTFLAGSAKYPSGAGGTSAPTPIFASMLAILEQAQKVTGYGVFNTVLYSTAGKAANAAAFHDITAGNNQVPCASPTETGCVGGVLGYTTNAGYDLVTGIGSIDLANFNAALSGTIGTVQATVTDTVTAPTTNPVAGASTTYTATISGGGSTPTGTVQFTSNGASVGPSVSLTNGIATISITLTTLGTNNITAVYSGDTTHMAAIGSLMVNVVSSPSADTLTLNVSSNPSVNLPITLTSQVTGNSPTGTIQFNLDGAAIGSPIALQNSVASTTTTVTTKGNHSLSAVYSGDTNNATINQTTVVNVTGYGASTALTTSDPTPIAGETVTFTATLSAFSTQAVPTGTVSFSVDGAVGTSEPITTGQSTFSTALSAGMHTITAFYSGDDIYNPGNTQVTLTASAPADGTTTNGSDSSGGGGSMNFYALFALLLMAGFSLVRRQKNSAYSTNVA